jgi:hypothetical protein
LEIYFYFRTWPDEIHLRVDLRGEYSADGLGAVDLALVDVRDGFASGVLHADFGMGYSDSKDFGLSLELETEAAEVDPTFDMAPVDLSADEVEEEESMSAV